MPTKNTVKIATADPASLLAQIKKEIDDGKIDTWSYDKDGDFTHIPDQWDKKAWLRPSVGTGALELTIVWPKNSEQDPAIAGVFLGRFIEMLVVHFSAEFMHASAVKK